MEDRGVVAANRRKEKVEDLVVRRREVDVAAPDPVRARILEVVDHPGRLRVVDDHEVVVLFELARVQLLVAPEDLPLLFGQTLWVSLERVMDRLRDIPELLGPMDDPPLV